MSDDKYIMSILEHFQADEHSVQTAAVMYD